MPSGAQRLFVVVNDQRLPDASHAPVIYTTADNPAAPYIVARNMLLDVGSLRALSLARSLIDECTHKHKLPCRGIAPPQDTRLPSRLIDCTDPSHPRLTPSEGYWGKYLALSYVWGEAQPHQTTKANIATYVLGIDATLLPQTIRDAIYVTHTLGFRHLWVDSLCIVQDSDEDKGHELGRMHLVYRRAWVTIIAASASRASDGFLQKRVPRPSDVTLPFICPRRPGERQLVGTMHLSLPGGPLSGPEDPTTTRAWCLQEAMMSPRTLTFTSETLQFSCPMRKQNVGGAFLNRYTRDQRLPAQVVLRDTGPPHRDLQESHWLNNAWWSIVGDYTRRALSDPLDKLVACGTIAEAFHRACLGWVYLAGLWLPSLLYDLVWERNWLLDGSTLSRSPSYRAPSWSWASVDGPVRRRWVNKLDATTLAQIVDWRIRLKDPVLQFGQVKSGYLILRAAVISLKQAPAVEILVDDYADEEAVGNDYASLIPLLLDQTHWTESVHGLVVAPVDTAGEAALRKLNRVYRRIGVFMSWGRDDCKALCIEPAVEVGLV